MKRLIIAVVALAIAAPASAGVLGGFVNNLVMGKGETVDPGIQYKLEVSGNNLRVYEWTPAYNKNMRCVFVAGNSNSTGVACYEVSEDKKKD